MSWERLSRLQKNQFSAESTKLVPLYTSLYLLALQVFSQMWGEKESKNNAFFNY
jgi:hypothetical protein